MSADVSEFNGVSKVNGQETRHRSRAFTNGLWNGLGNIVNMSTGILGSLIVVRTLSITDYGTLSYYLWLSSSLGVIGLLAFPHGHTKVVSELNGEGRSDAANDISAWATSVVFLFNLFIGLCLIAYALLRVSNVEKPYLLIIAGVLLPNSMATMLGSRLAAMGRYSWSSVAVQLSSGAQLGLLVWGYFHHWTVTPYLFTLLSPAIFQLALLVAGNRDSLRIYLRIFRRPDQAAFKKYLDFVVPMTLVVLYERIVWDRSGILFLKIFKDVSQIGYYNLAFTTFGMFLNLGLALINGYWPAMSNLFGAGQNEAISTNVRKGVLVSFLYTVPLALGGLITLPTLISAVYGHKMLPAGLVTMVLIVGLIPGVVNGMFSLTLSACGFVWTNVRTGLFTSAISVVLDLIFIPHFGALGGAIACGLSQLLNCIVLMSIVVKRLNISLPWRKLAEVCVIGSLATMFVPAIFLVIHSGIIYLLISIIVSAAIYGVCILKLGYLRLVRE